MALSQIPILILAVAVIRLVRSPAARSWLMLLASVLAIFWLQPGLPVRGLDFWLPVVTLLLVVVCWAAVTSPAERGLRENALTGLALGGLVLAVALTRYLSLTGLITPSRPPQTLAVVGVIAAATLISGGLFRLPRPLTVARWILTSLVLACFVVLKLPPLAQALSATLRQLNGQPAALATALDLRWLGYSYMAFRLLHTLRDRQTGRLPAVSLKEYLIYVIFFPSLPAGPLDRLERFVRDLRRGPLSLEEDLLPSGQRLVTGLFKKFVLADSLALVALNATNAAQVKGVGWAWLLLYAYSLMIYLDFSGYTDIAIGLGRLMGIRLPENFNAPYLKPNLTQFWNSWHMTLTQWIRGYFYNPLTRVMLRRREKPIPVWLVVLTGQVATMLLIGLWHGITANFVLWGLWHGLGLFFQNRWSDWLRPRFSADALPAWGQMALRAGGTLLTFQYVTLGWLFFALPAPDLSLAMLRRLFGG
ncbi:MAG TPA: MBOAT family O-acyltransferase [Anaerolineaceae bacterium]|nr:MBOAT family O-acyltransferase [Anaerolineaceae bacterium]